MNTTVIDRHPTQKITFDKLIYRGQHAYFVHKVEDAFQTMPCSETGEETFVNPDPQASAYEVAKRKGLKVLDVRVINIFETPVQPEGVHTTISLKDRGRGRGPGEPRYYLVKCMAPVQA